MEGQIGTGGPGGGYVFSPADLELVIAEWELLHRDLMEDGRQLQALMSVRGPGDEVASDYSARRANDSGTSFMGHHRGMVDAVGDYVARLKAARTSYVSREDAANELLTGVSR